MCSSKLKVLSISRPNIFCFLFSQIFVFPIFAPKHFGAIALSYPPRVRGRATVKLSAAFFHDESSITIGQGGGVRKCNSANISVLNPESSDIYLGLISWNCFQTIQLLGS